MTRDFNLTPGMSDVTPGSTTLWRMISRPFSNLIYISRFRRNGAETTFDLSLQIVDANIVGGFWISPSTSDHPPVFFEEFSESDLIELNCDADLRTRIGMVLIGGKR